MSTRRAYDEFTNRLKLLIQKNPSLITITLSNIFTMRLVGNKTHGDLAEIAISEFINQYMYDYKSTHVGKDLFRAKSNEEDIKITDEINSYEFPVSLKAYGDGPLQLSTDKNFKMYPRLKKEGNVISNKKSISNIFNDNAFEAFKNINILPLIYDEQKQKCNIMVFDYEKAMKNTYVIYHEPPDKRRKHPTYRFYDNSDNYICEVRYGNAAANALQRGLWSHTKHGLNYFKSLTNGWIDYSHNKILVKLFSHALVSSQSGHTQALEELKQDILKLKQGISE